MLVASPENDEERKEKQIIMALHSEIFVFCTWMFGSMEEREAVVADCSIKTGGRKRKTRRNRNAHVHLCCEVRGSGCNAVKDSLSGKEH